MISLMLVASFLVGQASSWAQEVVRPTCPPGYTLQGDLCVSSNPLPNCPSAFVFSEGKCLPETAATATTRKTAYEGHWRRVEGWSGEYANGFTLQQDVSTKVRAVEDPSATRDIVCTLKAGETYHPWNEARVASSELAFVSYTPTVVYVVNRSGTFYLRDESDDREFELTIEAGEEWSFLTYYAEGMFQMAYDGTIYTGEQDLYEASSPRELDNPLKDTEADEWLKLTCANGNRGWILMSEISQNPFFGEPNIVDYGQAADL